MGTVAKAEIPCKFPSFNEYVKACRTNRYKGADYKKRIENTISYFLADLPIIQKPIFVQITWVEGNNKRDWDNVIYAKKFIMDAIVALGKLPNDGRKNVKGYTDICAYEKGVWKAIIEIIEIDEKGER